MVKYCMNLSDEKKETAIKIALESKGNVRKRKIAVPLLMILGIVIIFSSIFLIINSPAILWYIYMVLGIVCLLLAFNAKSFQKFVLKKAELLLDKSFRTGIVEYHFDAEGIETISQMGYSKNYWTAFKEYGTMGQYADKMPNAPRHQQSVAGKIPVFLLRSAQRKGNGLCHRGLFTNNQNTHSSFSCLSGSLALSASS